MKKWKNFMAAALVIVMTAVLAFPATETEAASAPKKTKITFLKSQSAGKVTVTYKRINGCKYQIQVATNSRMSKGKKSYKTSAVSRTMSLKKGKKYWVRIRTYKKVGKKTKYSKWSAKKAVTVRKTGSVSSGHVHSYTIPVTEKRTVMKQVPFSQAKYQLGKHNVNTENYYRIEYGALTYNRIKGYYAVNGYYSDYNASGTPAALYIFSNPNNEELEYLEKNNYMGWVEVKYNIYDICQKCGYLYGKDEVPGTDGCKYSWRSSELVSEVIVHKATPTTQTVTVGKKCSCGKIRYN